MNIQDKISKQITNSTNSLEVNCQETLGSSRKVSNDKGLLKYPSELQSLIQWVTWRSEKISLGKTTKRPYIAGLPKYPTNRARVDDPTTWRDYPTALLDISNQNISNQKCNGIGYVFIKDDPYLFIDLDKCVDKKTDVIEPWALDIIEKLQSYTEKSQSYDDPEKDKYGIHIIVRACLPEGAGNRKGNFEIYTQGRYCAMTGNVLKGYPVTIEERQEQVNQICSEIWSESEPEQKPSRQEPSTITLSDQEIIEKASKAKNSDKFKRLFYEGNISGYPSGSEADLALVDLIAFYTQNEDQIISIMKQSALYDDKWNREDYQRRTIAKALSGSGDRYNPGGNRGSNDKSSKGDPVTEKTQAEPVADSDQESENKLVIEFNQSDYGNAERLVYWHGDNIRYSYSDKRWYVWNGKYWQADNSGHIQRMAKDTVRRIYAEASLIKGESEEDAKKRKEISSHAGKSEANIKQKAMIELAQSEKDIAIESYQLDSDPMLLNCLNCTIDLRTGETFNHNRNQLITKIIPVAYDPKAKLDMWDKFLKTATGNNEAIESFLQYAVGYSLTGDTSEEKLFFIHGPAASGKSTFIESIKSTLGSYAKTSDFETFIARNFVGGIRNDIAELAGSRFVSSIEVDKGKKLADGLVKLITGGDTVRARFLYHESFEFLPQFKLWLVANDKPVINPDDSAMWRRILAVPFEHVIPEDERDPKVKATLKNPEIAGQAILAWAVQGCLRWQEYGLLVPKEIKKNTDAYRQEMDVMSDFVEEMCIIKTGTIVTKQALYNQYKQWCIDGGVEPEGRNSFGQRLINNYNVKEDTGTGNVYLFKGIGLKSLTPQDNNT